MIFKYDCYIIYLHHQTITISINFFGRVCIGGTMYSNDIVATNYMYIRQSLGVHMRTEVVCVCMRLCVCVCRISRTSPVLREEDLSTLYMKSCHNGIYYD